MSAKNEKISSGPKDYLTERAEAEMELSIAGTGVYATLCVVLPVLPAHMRRLADEAIARYMAAHTRRYNQLLSNK